MDVCRTCLSKHNLKPLFPDKNLMDFHSQQLNLVCGIKIVPNDGYSQLICNSCKNLVNGALKLREICKKSEEYLKYTIELKTEPIFNQESEETEPQTKNDRQNTKEGLIEEGSHTKKSEYQYSVRIEDFESSNDSDFINDFLNLKQSFLENNELNSLKSICEEDIESSDGINSEFENIIKKESVDVRSSDVKEGEILERERKKMLWKAQEKKLLSLAVTPYDTGGPIKCIICDRKLGNLHTFKAHAKKHFEWKNACEECGKKFFNQSQLRYHQQRVHGKKKRLACNKCHYRAVDQRALQNHDRLVHTGERPYICDVCGQSFTMRLNIVQHMRSHFGVRNLQCERCPAMFRCQSELTGHQNRVHYLVYTYFCYLCTETYKRLSSVKQHLANVHGVSNNQRLPIKCVKSKKSK